MKDIRYKLATQGRTTHNGFQLPEDGVIFSAEDLISPTKPCSNTVLHHYADPRLAVIFNPIHADIKNPRIFRIECDELGTNGLKGWARHQRIVEEIELPVITLEQKVAFAIYCAEPFADAQWQSWAQSWMNGTERRSAAARTAEWGANAAYATARTAGKAAYSAANAAAMASLPDFIAIIDRVMQ